MQLGVLSLSAPRREKSAFANFWAAGGWTKIHSSEFPVLAEVEALGLLYPRQPVPQLTLVPQGEQQHIPFAVGVEHDMTCQHQLAEFRHAERLRELGGLMCLKLPPAGLGVEESGWATTRGRE